MTNTVISFSLKKRDILVKAKETFFFNFYFKKILKWNLNSIHYNELFNNLIESSTVHGFSNIFMNRNWLSKLFWIFCFLFSSGYCIYNFTQTFSEFTEFKVNTKFFYERRSSIEFPSISFCNKNPFNLRKNKTAIQNLKTEIDALKNNVSKINSLNIDTFLTLIDLGFHFPNLVLKYLDFFV